MQIRAKKIKRWIQSWLKSRDILIIRHSTHKRILLEASSSAAQDLALLQALPNEMASMLLMHLKKSRSQLRQDLFVLSHLNFKKRGFFVEFGATNGQDLSNTYLLEKEFAWDGVLAEPAKCWHKDLKKNRCSSIEKNCVWRDSDSTLTFNEFSQPEFSTVKTYTDLNYHKELREQNKSYNVKTISLYDMLVKHEAPSKIDYLSIDTEGTEFEILSAFDFSKYSFEIITCEHNFTPEREKILKLLSHNGYKRVYTEFSKFDDWYVKSS